MAFMELLKTMEREVTRKVGNRDKQLLKLLKQEKFTRENREKELAKPLSMIKGNGSFSLK